MAYFGGSLNLRGDPGFFGSLFGAVKGLVRGGLGIQPGTAASQFVRPTTGQQVTRVPGLRGKVQRVLPGGATGFQVGPDGVMRKKRRRMNAGNAKALRRAIRRTDAFVTLARSSLKNTGFKIVSKSSGKVSRATMDKAVAAAHHKR